MLSGVLSGDTIPKILGGTEENHLNWLKG